MTRGVQSWGALPNELDTADSFNTTELQMGVYCKAVPLLGPSVMLSVYHFYDEQKIKLLHTQFANTICVWRSFIIRHTIRILNSTLFL